MTKPKIQSPKSCRFCGSVFVPRRKTAIFCSDRCRVGYKRVGDGLLKDVAASLSALRRLGATCDKYPDLSTDAFALLRDVFAPEFKVIANDLARRRSGVKSE